MNSNNDIFSNGCNLIFEGRNQQYGAYQHRQNSMVRHFEALLVASLTLIIGATAPALMHRILSNGADRDLQVRVISDFVLEKPKIMFCSLSLLRLRC